MIYTIVRQDKNRQEKFLKINAKSHSWVNGKDNGTPFTDYRKMMDRLNKFVRARKKGYIYCFYGD
jgi:hypothetical protein